MPTCINPSAAPTSTCWCSPAVSPPSASSSAASRLLDPWFGNSLIVWASLIGLIMLYLSVGYWLGGRLADRSPHLLTLLRLAGLGAWVLAWCRSPLRRCCDWPAWVWPTLMPVCWPAAWSGILVLFAIPVTLLGCVSPFAIRLGLREISGSGEFAGRVYALSTAGSILGSFLPVLVLIPNIGTRRTFATLAAALLLVILAGLLRIRRPWESLAGVLAVGFVVWLGWRTAGPIKPATGLIYETESAFNYIQVIQAGPERQLRLNEGEGIHSVYRPEGGRAYGIWDYFLLAPAFNPAPYGAEQVQRVYIAGLAAGTVARLYTDAYGPIAIDGAELDPAIIEVGRRYFAMNAANLHPVAADARRFLENQLSVPTADELTGAADGQLANVAPYDVVIVDTYRPPYIPFHLTTVEFFSLVRARLSANGVVAVNVGRTHTDYSLVDAIAATMREVFPSVYIVDEPDLGSELGNSLVVATLRPSTLADFRANLAGFEDPLVAEIAQEAGPNARRSRYPARHPDLHRRPCSCRTSRPPISVEAGIGPVIWLTAPRPARESRGCRRRSPARPDPGVRSAASGRRS